MIEFTCPGCLARCVANEAFTGMRARCVVCGAFIRIPADTGEVAFPLGPLPAGPLPSRPAKPAAAPKPPKPSVRPKSESGFVVPADPDAEPGDGEADESQPDSEVALQVAEDEPPKAAPPKPKTGKKAGKKAAKKTGDPDRDWAAFEGAADEMDAEPASPDGEEPREKRDSTAKAKKRKQLIIGGSVLASVVIACALAFSGDEKPKPVASAPQAEPEPEPPKPPPKKVEAPKVEPKKVEPAVVEVAPPPRAADSAVRVVAAQMLADRAANAALFDAENRGRLFYVRGTYGRTVNGVLFLAEGTDDTGGIACVPPKLSAKGPIEPPPEASSLQPGQAVVVRGWYSADLRLTDCRIVATSGPADEDYRDKDIELVGIVGSFRSDPEDAERFPSLVLESPSTDCPVAVRCLFRLTEREKIEKLRPGQAVIVRGKCAGRSFRVVRLHDCTLVPSDEAPTAGAVRVAAERFFAAYEVDLLPFDRPKPDVPAVEIAAERLVIAFASDPAAANAAYRYKSVAVKGKVLERRPGSRAVVLETGTSHKYQVIAIFTPSHFAALKDHSELTIRGVCIGVSSKYVRLENAEAVDPDAGNPATRTIAEFLPLRPGQELIYDMLTPAGATANPITRFSLKVAETDLVRMTLLRSGTLPKATLFADPPGAAKWTRDLSKQKTGGQTTQFRIADGIVETRDKPAAPAQPGSWWDPIFKFGLRRGETWASTMPDGRTITYTVAAFGKDATGRHTVEITRVQKNPKEPAVWEESTITYARGVGEVRRVVTRQSTSGKAFTILEMRLVETDTSAAELKKDPEPPKDPKKDEK